MLWRLGLKLNFRDAVICLKLTLYFAQSSMTEFNPYMLRCNEKKTLLFINKSCANVNE